MGRPDAGAGNWQDRTVVDFWLCSLDGIDPDTYIDEATEALVVALTLYNIRILRRILL